MTAALAPVGPGSRVRHALRAGALGLMLLAWPAVAVTVHDDLGSPVALPHPAQRIVSLAPHVTEILFAAGAGERVVGAVNFSDWPPAARALPQIGGAGAIDLEGLLALHPDLVVAWQSGNGARLIERLRALGLTVYVSEPRELADIPRTLERLGALAGSTETARRRAEAFRAGLAALETRYRDRAPVRVFYQVWHQPLMTVNGKHLISQVIRLCGGRNVFAELEPLAATVSIEAVLAAQPEVIIASGVGEERPSSLDAWRRWDELPAVRQGQLYALPPDLIQRHSPRILDGAEMMCRQLEQARD